MAKIDNNVAHALIAGGEFSQGNTVVQDGYVLLHGHQIASLGERDGRVALTANCCGYVTRTTVGRLNAIISRLTGGREKMIIEAGRAVVIAPTRRLYVGQDEDFVIYKDA